MNPREFQGSFERRLNTPLQLGTIFDHLPEVHFWVKDEQGRFVKVNQTLLRARGLEDEDAMVGRTDLEFYPRNLAEQYIEEDRRVMRGGVPIVNQAWLVPDHDGTLQWYISSKMPLFGDGGRVIGSAGVMRDYEKAGAVLAPYWEMEDVVKFVFTRYADKIEVRQMADILHLSVSQFDRKFKQAFQITPRQFLLRVRIHAACQALTSTDQSVAQIALRTGFYDHSSFTKQFRRQMGMTPTEYHKKYA
jgi:PAS domain S-box-containing protein